MASAALAPYWLGCEQSHGLIQSIRNGEHDRVPIEFNCKGTVCAPTGVINTIHLLRIRTFQKIGIRHIDRVGARVIETDEQIDIADVVALISARMVTGCPGAATVEDSLSGDTVIDPRPGVRDGRSEDGMTAW